MESVIKINLGEVKISSSSSRNVVFLFHGPIAFLAQPFEIDKTKISQKLYLLGNK